jgi:hypothetical protein
MSQLPQFKLLSETVKAFGDDIDSLFSAIETVENAIKNKDMYLVTEIYSPKAILNWILIIKVYKKLT